MIIKTDVPGTILTGKYKGWRILIEALDGDSEKGYLILYSNRDTFRFDRKTDPDAKVYDNYIEDLAEAESVLKGGGIHEIQWNSIDR